jgi:hypothetical protein
METVTIFMAEMLSTAAAVLNRPLVLVAVALMLFFIPFDYGKNFVYFFVLSLMS